MSLRYETTRSQVIIGSKTTAGTRTGVTLENSYQAESTTTATKTFSVAGMSKLALDILYTMGAAETANTIEIKVESSPDGVNFYKFVNDSTSGAVSTLTVREFTITGVNASTLEVTLPLDIFSQYIRVSFKETGVASNKGTLFCESTLLGQ